MPPTALGEKPTETEIASLPDEWVSVRLDSIADLESGGTPSKRRREWWSGRIPWASPKDMKKFRLSDTRDHISDNGLRNGSRLAPAKSIFVVVRGMVLAKDVPVALAEVPMAFNQDMKALVARPVADPEYLLYALAARKDALATAISTSAHGTRRMETSLLESLMLPLPPKDEQRRIAAVLAQLEAAVEVQGKVARALRELQAATMAKLFREGLRGEPLKQTEIGEVPRSWEVVQLRRVARVERGKFAHRPRNDPRFYGGTTPFIQTGDVARSSGSIRTHDQTLNDRGLEVSRVFPKGTIVLTIAANIADTGILEFDSAFPDSLVGITPDESIDARFLALYLRTQKAEMNRLAPRGTQKNINIQFLAPWPTPRPPLEEQRSIARWIKTIDDRLLTAEARYARLRNLFSSLLNLLMTGQARVPPGLIDGNMRTRPSGKPAPEVVDEIVRRIVEAVAPEKIILFGSAARGEMGPDSDLDLLVVKRCDDSREVARAVRACLRGVAPGRGKDVVVVTPEDVERDRDTIGYIIRPALREGRVLYAA